MVEPRAPSPPIRPEADPPRPAKDHLKSGRPGLDRKEIWRLSSRPAWSIRSRRGSVAPFLDLIRGLFRRR
ncbi:MAG: hypothetical protein WD969_11950 [Paracoccaceae bacterium]